MRHVISVSLGSSRRDAKAVVKLGDEECLVERIGTDGDKEKALQLLNFWRDKVDAFGLGGTDLYIYAGNKRYTFKESKQFLKAAGKTPLFDGSGLKINLEKKILRHLHEQSIVDLTKARVLLVCGVDRIGMAQAFSRYGSEIVFGDLMFGLGWPVPIRSLATLDSLANLIAPIITKMPIHYFYPIGANQERRTPKFHSYFENADIIAGDFHFIHRYMPDELAGKIVITNTITSEDREFLKSSKIKMLVTTTPDFGGRSFGTNVLEAALYAVKKKKRGREFCYTDMPEYLGIKPSIFYFEP